MKIKTLLLALFFCSAFNTLVNGQCSISNLIIEGSQCDADGFVTIDIEFDVENPGADNMFTITGNGTDYGQFEYGEDFYTIGPVEGDCETIYEVVITDVNDNDCSESVAFGAPFCCGGCDNLIVDYVGTNECTESGTFFMDILIDHPTSATFDIYIDGVDFGTFNYGDEIYTFGPFIGDCSTERLIDVQDLSIFCEVQIVLEPICCSEYCSISDITAEAIECTGDGNFSVEINFNYSEVEEDNFDLWSNGSYHGTYAYADLPIVVEDFPPNGNENPFATIFGIGEDALCADDLAFEGLECNGCAISGVEAEAFCTDDGLFLDVWFEITNPGASNQFVIEIWGEEFGPFEYGESFYTVGPVELPCEPFQPINVIDVDDNNCSEFFELELEQGLCCDLFDCSISNLEAEAYDCNENGEIYFDISFDVINPGSDNQFTVVGNGNNYGTFEYGEVFYTVGPFSADCETEVELIVTDLNNNDCTAFIGFDEIFCCEENTCEITTLDFGPNPDCIDGLIVSEWLIDGENLSEVGFDIFINNQFETFVEWNNDSWYDFDIEDPGTEFFTIKVCDNDNEECCIDWELENPCYDPNNTECTITNLEAEVYDCNEAGEIYFDIFFTVTNPGADNQFTVVGNGNNYGTFEYGEDYYTVGPFEADCETEVELIITDLNDNDCSAFIGFDEIFCCEEEECSIISLEVATTECDDGTDIELSFEIEGGSGETLITINDDTFGPYTDLISPITYISFLYETEYITVTMCDAEFPNCCETVEVLNPCYEPEEECNITTLDFGPNPECEDGFIVTEWLIDGENLSEVGFDIFINGEFESFVVWNENSWYDLEIENPETEIFTISVCDNDNEDCCISWDLENPCYEPNSEECSISEIEINASCDGSSTFFDLNFEYENNASSTFQIIVNDDFIESYAYADLPITVLGLNYESDYIVISITDNEDPDCTAIIEFDNPCYEDGALQCGIFDLEVEVNDCNDDGNIFFDISFYANNPGSDNQFTVLGNGNNYGTFEYGASNYTVGPFDADCETIAELVITDINLNDCSAVWEAEEAFCCDDVDPEECNIAEVFVEALECNEDDQVYFHLTFDYENIGDDNQFTVVGNGNNYGTFEYGLDFYEIGPIEADCETELEFIVTDVNFNDCSAFVGHAPVCCDEEGECALLEIIAETTECLDNNTFNLTIDLEVSGDINDFFDLSINGENIGFYEFADLPITIEELSYDFEVINIDICENDNENCCLSLDVINPCSEENNEQFFINEIEFELVSCEDDMVMMSLNFLHGDNDDQFEIMSGGTSYGIYEYASLPIMVENIPADGSTDYTFSIVDKNIEDLVGSFHVGTIACDGDIILDVDEEGLDPAEIKSITVFDITGKYLGTYSYEESQKIIDLDRSVSSGILILRIETATKVLTKKIVRVN